MARPSGSGSGSGSGGGKKPARQPVTGLNISEALTDAGIFIASQGFVGAFRMLFQGALADGIRKLFVKPDEQYQSGEFDEVLKFIRTHVASVYPGADRAKVERAIESYLLKAVDLYGNASLTPESRRIQLEAIKNALGQDLRTVQASQVSFQSRVLDMLDPATGKIAMTWIGNFEAGQRDRWAVIQDRIESPQAFAAAMELCAPGGAYDDGKRDTALVALENLTAKPKQITAKSMLDQIGELINSPTLARMFSGRKPLPARETVVDFAAPPPDYRRPETNDEYRARLIADGTIKAEDDFAVLLRDDKKHAARDETLARIDAEDDAIMRLARGEFKNK